MSNVKRLLILGIAAGLAFSVMGNTAAGFNLGKVLNKVGVSTTESSEEPLYEGEPADLKQIITLLLINRTGTVLSPWYVMRDMSSVLIRNGKTC